MITIKTNASASELVGRPRTGGQETVRLRVCLFTETFYPVVGGGEIQARVLAARLIARGVSIFVVTGRSQRHLAPTELIDSIPIVRVGPAGFIRFGKYLMLVPAFMMLVRLRASYDIIYVSGYRILGVAALVAGKLLRKRVVLKADCEGEFTGQFVYDDSRVVQSRILTWIAQCALRARNALLRRADLFISISDPISEELRQHRVHPALIRSIPNGIVTDVFCPITAEEKRRLRRALCLPEQQVVVMYSGKLNRYKGLESLLRVWRRVVAFHPDAYLILVGSGEGQFTSCEPFLRQYMQGHGLSGHVRFTGFVTNVQQYLQASDLYVFPSEREGFSVALLEALACGLPVVATKVGAAASLIDGVSNGLLVDPESDEALEQAVSSLLERRDGWAALGVCARRTAERFSMDRVAEQYVDVFQELQRCSNHAGLSDRGSDE